MKWLYAAVFFTMLSVSFIISGCGADADESCAYQVERDIDQGDYDAVIAALDNNGTCNGALSQDTAWTNLAAAYLGKAGITLSNIVGSVLDSNATDPMAAMLESFAASASSSSLQSMNSAGKIYAYIRAAEG
ncbi:MAG: hypothetical protein OEW60_08075, partial [Thiovulaceae bacterium]|nr:hypothetical protein [Sulfurimonadaceae bacterium]